MSYYYPQRPVRRRGCSPGCLISLLVLAVLLFISYATFARSWAIFGPTTISIKAHPTLIIQSQRYAKIDLPTIHIHAGTDANAIILQVINPGNVALPWNFGIGGWQESSDGSSIILDGDPVGGRRLDITVPLTINLKISANAVNIDVVDVTGQMTLDDNSGSITLTHCTVNGPALLHNNSGAITVRQSTLNGQVTIKNNTGPTTFEHTGKGA
ncbi:MAG TPA: hypothetical protein VKR06_12785 [Ktedonosporobacter sp.]|nr:hypothetical protein [Ktedonosporobacter sp.]